MCDWFGDVCECWLWFDCVWLIEDWLIVWWFLLVMIDWLCVVILWFWLFDWCVIWLWLLWLLAWSLDCCVNLMDDMCLIVLDWIDWWCLIVWCFCWLLIVWLNFVVWIDDWKFFLFFCFFFCVFFVIDIWFDWWIASFCFFFFLLFYLWLDSFDDWFDDCGLICDFDDLILIACALWYRFDIVLDWCVIAVLWWLDWLWLCVLCLVWFVALIDLICLLGNWIELIWCLIGLWLWLLDFDWIVIYWLCLIDLIDPVADWCDLISDDIDWLVCAWGYFDLLCFWLIDWLIDGDCDCWLLNCWWCDMILFDLDCLFVYDLLACDLILIWMIDLIDWFIWLIWLIWFSIDWYDCVIWLIDWCDWFDCFDFAWWICMWLMLWLIVIFVDVDLILIDMLCCFVIAWFWLDALIAVKWCWLLDDWCAAELIVCCLVIDVCLIACVDCLIWFDLMSAVDCLCFAWFCFDFDAWFVFALLWFVLDAAWLWFIIDDACIWCADWLSDWGDMWFDWSKVLVCLIIVLLMICLMCLLAVIAWWWLSACDLLIGCSADWLLLVCFVCFLHKWKNTFFSLMWLLLLDCAWWFDCVLLDCDCAACGDVIDLIVLPVACGLDCVIVICWLIVIECWLVWWLIACFCLIVLCAVIVMIDCAYLAALLIVLCLWCCDCLFEVLCDADFAFLCFDCAVIDWLIVLDIDVTELCLIVLEELLLDCDLDQCVRLLMIDDFVLCWMCYDVIGAFVLCLWTDDCDVIARCDWYVSDALIDLCLWFDVIACDWWLVMMW